MAIETPGRVQVGDARHTTKEGTVIMPKKNMTENASDRNLAELIHAGAWSRPLPEKPTRKDIEAHAAEFFSVPARAARLRLISPERWGTLSDAEVLRRADADIVASDARRTAEKFPELAVAIEAALKRRGLELAEAI